MFVLLFGQLLCLLVVELVIRQISLLPQLVFGFFGYPVPTLDERGLQYEIWGMGPRSTYTGTAEQNSALLGKLAGGSSPSPTPISPTIQADQIQPPAQMDLPTGSQSQFVTGLTSQVDTYRNQLEGTLAKQKEETDAKLADLRQKEKDTLAKVEPLTQPFREELETTERERLFINDNFEANQKLIKRL